MKRGSTLNKADGGAQVLTGVANANASYDRSQQRYNDLRAARDAEICWRALCRRDLSAAGRAARRENAMRVAAGLAGVSLDVMRVGPLDRRVASLLAMTIPRRGARQRQAMLLYLGQRIALFVATLVFASLVVFAVMQILPGDAAQTMLGPTATPEAVAALSHKLGLDLPAPIRYARWIGGALHGDLGLSYAYGSPIGPLDRLEPRGQRAAGADGDGARRNHRACRRRLCRDRRGRGGDAIVMGFSQIGIAVPTSGGRFCSCWCSR